MQFLIFLIRMIIIASSSKISFVNGKTIGSLFCTQFEEKDGHIFEQNQKIIRPQKFSGNCMRYFTEGFYPELNTIKGSHTYLNNWIGYDFTLLINDLGLEFLGIVLQADSDEFAGFGQFVPCKNSISCSKTIQDQEVNFVSCRYYQSVEPLPPTMFAYFLNPPVTSIPLTSILWKFSHSLCNHPTQITFRGLIFLREKADLEINDNALPEERPPLAFLLPPMVVTVSNTLPVGGPAPNRLPDDFSFELLDRAPWVRNVENFASKLKQKFKYSLAECEKSIDGSFNCHKLGIPRCRFSRKSSNEDDDEKDFVTEVRYRYYNVAKPNAIHPEYRSYVDARLDFYCRCGKPKGAEHEPDLLYLSQPERLNPLPPLKAVPPRRNPKQELPSRREGWNPTHGLDLATFPGKDVWTFRLIHGITEVFSGMFITPVSIFMARHYKETFMKSKMFFNKPWLMVHLLGVFINIQLHLYGIFAMICGRKIVGVPIHNKNRDIKPEFLRKSGDWHSVIGTWTIVGFGFIIVFGGLRSNSKVLRKFLIFVHWLLGFSYYVASLLLIISSAYIEASPSDESFKHETEKLDPRNPTKPHARDDLQQHVIPFIVISWFILDIFFHIGMDIMRACYDRVLKIKRPFFIVSIPVLNETNLADLPGSLVRKILLGIYILLALSFTTLVCVLMSRPVKSAAGFGPMTCSHSKDGKAFDINALKNCDVLMLFDPSVFTKQLPKIPNITFHKF